MHTPVISVWPSGLQPLASHGDQPAVAADADEAPELDRARTAKASGVRQSHELLHGRNVGSRERRDVEISLRGAQELEHHLIAARRRRSTGPGGLTGLAGELTTSSRHAGTGARRRLRQVGRIADVGGRGRPAERERARSRRIAEPLRRVSADRIERSSGTDGVTPRRRPAHACLRCRPHARARRPLVSGIFEANGYRAALREQPTLL